MFGMNVYYVFEFERRLAPSLSGKYLPVVVSFDSDLMGPPMTTESLHMRSLISSRSVLSP